MDAMRNFHSVQNIYDFRHNDELQHAAFCADAPLPSHAGDIGNCVQEEAARATFVDHVGNPHCHRDDTVLRGRGHVLPVNGHEARHFCGGRRCAIRHRQRRPACCAFLAWVSTGLQVLLHKVPVDLHKNDFFDRAQVAIEVSLFQRHRESASPVHGLLPKPHDSTGLASRTWALEERATIKAQLSFCSVFLEDGRRTGRRTRDRAYEARHRGNTAQQVPVHGAFVDHGRKLACKMQDACSREERW
mmetsp:Transcript_65831/g.183401  ORF Transcript_65831/g.183401 Transcript_65831/m.183401 type:complete len:245 (+) Transcript_65831:99-833(+)